MAHPRDADCARGDGTSEVVLPGASETARSGAPVLPFVAELIAVPPGATVTLRVILVEESDRPLPGPLALAPFPEGVQRDATGQPIGGDFSAISPVQPDQRSEGSRDGEPVVLESAGIARGVHLARLVFYPARPIGNYPQAHIRLTTHVRIFVTFAGQADGQLRSPSPDPLVAALGAAVINPEQVQLAQVTSPNPRAEIQSQLRNVTDAGRAWALEVATPGLTAITYEALAGSGFPVASSNPHMLHLARAGSAIAAEWDGDENDTFDLGERLLFYAAPRFSRWTATDTYFLWQDDTPGLRMQDRPASPTNQSIGVQPMGIVWTDAMAEANHLYTPDCFCGSIPSGRDGDHWTWDDLKRPGHPTAAHSIHLPTVDATQPATLTVWLIGYTNVGATPDHRVDLDLNGTPVGRVEWDGKQAITTTLPIPPGILHGDVNTLTLMLPGIPGVSIEGAWLDAFSIRYARGSAPVDHSVIFSGQPVPTAYTLALSSTSGLRLYDSTNPARPLRLTDVLTDGNTISFNDPSVGGSHHYVLTTESGLLFPVALRPAQPLQTNGDFTGADYLIVAPAEFLPALDDLITLRQGQGLTVATETVQAIYDAYGDGRPDPMAIRAYLADAYAAWTPRPTYIMLVGDGSFDPRQYRAGSPPTVIPPYLVDVDPWAGETAADNRYVTVDGQDLLPDMLIGRLPVKTLAETQVVVDKIVQYEVDPFLSEWNGNVIFVADKADGGGNFAATSEIMATTYVTPPFTAQRIYYTPPSTMITTTRQAVLDHWNAGALLVQFSGHSSWQQWSAEQFLHLEDVPALRNDRRWPVVVGMTCFTSAFHRPEPTLDETLLLRSGGGAAATWGATGLGVGTGHSHLAEGFFRSVFDDVSGTVGQATLGRKIVLGHRWPASGLVGYLYPSR